MPNIGRSFKGQFTFELQMLLVAVALAVMAVVAIFARSINGNLKSSLEDLTGGEQYEPGVTTVTIWDPDTSVFGPGSDE